MISFIIIGRNEERFLSKCIVSIMQVVEIDKIDEWESIYVDSQSIDKSVVVAKSFPQVRVFQITGDYNAAVARNIGAQEARGNVLFFVDGDMEILPGFLPKVLDEEGNLNYPFVSGLFNDVVHDNDWNYLYTHIRSGRLNEDRYETTTGGLFLISRTLWDRVGGMDTRFKRSQDFDLGLRVSKMGYPLLRKGTLLANHYMKSYEIREDFVSNIKYTALLLKKHIGDISYWKIFVRQQYTTIFLLLSFGLFFASPWCALLYVVALLYKGRKARTQCVTTIWNMIKRDVVLLWALATFNPQAPILKYKQL